MFAPFEDLNPIVKLVFPDIATEQMVDSESFSKEERWILEPVPHLRLFPSHLAAERRSKRTEANREGRGGKKEKLEAEEKDKPQSTDKQERQSDVSSGAPKKAEPPHPLLRFKRVVRLWSTAPEHTEDAVGSGSSSESESDTDVYVKSLSPKHWNARRRRLRRGARQERAEDREIKVERVCIFVHREYATLRTERIRAQEVADFLNCAVLAIEYPRYSKASLRENDVCTVTSLQNAVETLLGYLVKRELSLERIILCGESCGAGIVSLVATKWPKIGGMLLLNPFTSLKSHLSEVLLPAKQAIGTLAKALFPDLPNSFQKFFGSKISLLTADRMPVKETLKRIQSPFLALAVDAPGLTPNQRRVYLQNANDLNLLPNSAASQFRLPSPSQLDFASQRSGEGKKSSLALVAGDKKYKYFVQNVFWRGDPDKNSSLLPIRDMPVEKQNEKDLAGGTLVFPSALNLRGASLQKEQIEKRQAIEVIANTFLDCASPLPPKLWWRRSALGEERWVKKGFGRTEVYQKQSMKELDTQMQRSYLVDTALIFIGIMAVIAYICFLVYLVRGNSRRTNERLKILQEDRRKLMASPLWI